MGKVESEAEAIYDKLGRGAATDVKTIRDALLAAEKRGREDGAKIAERFWVENGEGSFDDGVGLAAQQIAAAIRSGS